MSHPMYFVPHPDDVRRAKESTCHLATPKDPSDCVGSKCYRWNIAENKPCSSYRPRIQDER
jgi:hypothetical protein